MQHTSGHSLMVVAELWAQCNGVTLDLSPLEISSKLSSRCCSTQQCSNFFPLFLQSVTHLIRCRACHLHSHVNSGHWLLLSPPLLPHCPQTVICTSISARECLPVGNVDSSCLLSPLFVPSVWALHPFFPIPLLPHHLLTSYHFALLPPLLSFSGHLLQLSISWLFLK